MERTERKIICKDCRDEFILAAGEQEFYESKGLALPKRCPNCRKLNKEKNKASQKKSLDDMLKAINLN